MTTSLPHRRDALFRALSEASLLAPDDPRRRELEELVVRTGGGVEETWLSLLEEGERWRLALGRVEPPADLEARLLDLPRQEGRWGGLATGVRRRPLLAASILLVAAGALLLVRPGPSTAERAVADVALLALNDHLDTHRNEVESEDADALRRALDPLIPFRVEIPPMGAGIEPVGGRRCTLGSHPVAFTSWRGPGGRLTLLQLRAEEFGLPESMPPRRVRPDGQAARARPLEVLLFGHAGFAWAVVADDPGDLERVLAARDRVGR